jgi:hypothetical protein
MMLAKEEHSTVQKPNNDEFERNKKHLQSCVFDLSTSCCFTRCPTKGINKLMACAHNYEIWQMSLEAGSEAHTVLVLLFSNPQLQCNVTGRCLEQERKTMVAGKLTSVSASRTAMKTLLKQLLLMQQLTVFFRPEASCAP